MNLIKILAMNYKSEATVYMFFSVFLNNPLPSLSKPLTSPHLPFSIINPSTYKSCILKKGKYAGLTWTELQHPHWKIITMCRTKILIQYTNNYLIPIDKETFIKQKLPIFTIYKRAFQSREDWNLWSRDQVLFIF